MADTPPVIWHLRELSIFPDKHCNEPKRTRAVKSLKLGLTKVRINWKEVCGPSNSILTGHIFTFFEFCLILFCRYRSLNLFNLILILIQPID